MSSNFRDLIVAIDPGDVESGYVLMDQHTCAIVEKGKVGNDSLLHRLFGWALGGAHVVIEMIASYGMPVGKEVFETCVWIGRFIEAARRGFGVGGFVERVTRLTVKLHHCHSTKATDATVRQALVDRFACGARNHGKGTKSEPGWFYGFRDDIWQAYAVGVWYSDILEGRVAA